MKKANPFLIFLIGGCAGVTGICIAYLIAATLLGEMSEEILEFAKVVIVSFLCFGFGTAIIYKFIFKMQCKVEKLEIYRRKRILKWQITIIFAIIVMLLGIAIICAFKKIMITILINVVMCTCLALWLVGAILGYKNITKTNNNK